MKRLLIIIALTLAMTTLLACGPVAQPDQEQLGNMPVAKESEDPTPTPEPIPTPVPPPTTCITSLGDDNQPEERCWTPPTPRPTKYPGLPKELDYAAQDATESGGASDSEGRRSSGDNPADYVNVVALVEEGVSDEAYAEAIRWLKDEDIPYRERKRVSIGVFIRIDQLPSLVALEAITSVYVPEPATIPREPPNPNP